MLCHPNAGPSVPPRPGLRPSRPTRLRQWSIIHPSEQRNGKKSSKVSDKLNRGHPTAKGRRAHPREATLCVSSGCSCSPPRVRGTRRHRETSRQPPVEAGLGQVAGKHMSKQSASSCHDGFTNPQHATSHHTLQPRDCSMAGYPPCSLPAPTGYFHGRAKSG